jgi:colicin import membrane protein
MKTRQVTQKSGQYSVSARGGVSRVAGLLVAVLAALSMPSDRVFAALMQNADVTSDVSNASVLTLWNVAQATAPPGQAVAGEAVVPPVRRETPQTPPAAVAPATTPAAAPEQPPPAAAEPVQQPPAVAPAAAPSQKKPDPLPQQTEQQAGKAPPPPPDVSGIFGPIQDWLARANREYQGVVVKELSLPTAGPAGGPTAAPPAGMQVGKPADDEIAKKLKEQQAEEAGKAAEKKRAEELSRKTADDKAAADAKAREAKKLDEDRKRAAETKRLADEAKKKADELFKVDADKKPDLAQPATPPKVEPKPEPKPEVVQQPAAPKPDEAAKLAEQQRIEAQKLADEAKRQEQVRQEQQRKTEEARRQTEDRKKAEAAARLEAEQRRRAADAEAAASVKNRSRTVVLVPEPIARPVDSGSSYRPEMSSTRSSSRSGRVRDTRVSEGDTESVETEPKPRRRVLRIYREATYRGITAQSYRRTAAYRGTQVKRWVWRSNGEGCRAAGRRITPPARYTVKRGDSLWRISARHYNNGRLYPKIYRANRSTIADPDLIYPCQRVLVPR